ncbi:hypothetical protein L3Q82_006728 [Scortum barcoo]|uniref:Uncharacterized protein n=1 Tax=Scortum barcoo TaxID=214431 RepID=A0ACB8WVL0_9TELE|nr:hypothetical protein L3Q82_006728 [Scortum barcoo]
MASEFGGADSHPSRFTLGCKPLQYMLKKEMQQHRPVAPGISREPLSARGAFDTGPRHSTARMLVARIKEVRITTPSEVEVSRKQEAQSEVINKMGEMKLRIVSAKIDRCVAIVTETWLDNNIPDGASKGPGSGWGLIEMRRRTRPTTRTVQVWTEEASSALQDCFECTDWEVFKEGTDLDGYTSSVLSYLKFCTDAVLPTKNHQGFPKSKTMAGQHSEAPTQSL